MTKKADKEKAAIGKIEELNKERLRLINCPTADPVELAALAVQYMHNRMPKMGKQIMQEALDRDHRKFVPECGIIVNTETTGYGGTNETALLSVRVDDHCVFASVGLLSGD